MSHIILQSVKKKAQASPPCEDRGATHWWMVNLEVAQRAVSGIMSWDDRLIKVPALPWSSRGAAGDREPYRATDER